MEGGGGGGGGVLGEHSFRESCGSWIVMHEVSLGQACR